MLATATIFAHRSAGGPSGIVAAHRFTAGTTDPTAFFDGWTPGDPTWTRDANGGWSEKRAATPPIHIHPNDDVPYLYLQTEARTNVVRHCRDASNAAYTKSESMTAARNATGIDGVANSASTLATSADDQTCYQAIPNAGRSWRASCFVRRKSGTGAIYFSPKGDGGTGEVEISGGINAVTFTRVETSSTEANPNPGFRIATSGDAIEIDFLQVEAVAETGGLASMPILTTTTAATRNADLVPEKTVALTSGADASIKWDGRLLYREGAYAGIACLDQDATDFKNAIAITHQYGGFGIFGFTRTGGVSQLDQASTVSYALGDRHAAMVTCSANDHKLNTNGASDVSEGAGMTNPPNLDTLKLGSRGGASSTSVILLVHEVAVWDENADAAAEAETAPVG